MCSRKWPLSSRAGNGYSLSFSGSKGNRRWNVQLRFWGTPIESAPSSSKHLSLSRRFEQLIEQRRLQSSAAKIVSSLQISGSSRRASSPTQEQMFGKSRRYFSNLFRPWPASLFWRGFPTHENSRLPSLSVNEFSQRSSENTSLRLTGNKTICWSFKIGFQLWR